MELEGLVNHHTRQCTVPTCRCLQLSKSDSDLSTEEDEKLWYGWVQDLIDDGLEKFPRSSRLHLLSVFVQYAKLKNTFKALTEIEVIESMSRISQEDFACFYYKTLIEQEIVDNDETEKEFKGTEFSKVMAFHEGFTELQVLLSEAIAYYIDFWSELLESSPQVTRLYSYGAQVVNNTDLIMEKYTNLNAINPNHIRLHQVYGDFVKIAIPESNESTKAFEKLADETHILMTRHQIDTNDAGNIEDDQGRFIILSGSHKNMGVITDIGPTIPEMCGYSKAELIGRNVSMMMPKIFGEVHDRLLRTYLLNTSETVHDPHRDKAIYVLNKDGYVIPCDITVYILPSLREGIRLAGFLHEIDAPDTQKDDFNEGIIEQVNKAPYYILFNADTHLLQGVSYNCWRSFGISSRLVEGNEVAGDVGIEDLFKEFGRLDQEKLKSEQGIETVLDTSKLGQYHFLEEQALREVEENNNEEDEGSEYREQLTRFREARVIVTMIAETDYFGNRVQVLKFIKVTDESETQRVKSPKMIKKHNLLAFDNKAEVRTKDGQSGYSIDVEEEADGIGEGSGKLF
ncbi:MAG: PAS domain S-box protein [Flavobacterium sp.]|nr:MAG: PAS domain S-box protein [Flavobacterium sp.]